MLGKLCLLLVQMLLALVLAACSLPATPTEMPTATTETAVPVSPVPTSVPTKMDDAGILSQALLEDVTAVPGAAISNFPSVSCCMGRTVQAGSYRLPAWLDMPLSVEVGDGWRVMNEEGARLFTLVRGQNSLNNPSELIVFMNVTSAGPVESLMAQFLGEPNITPISEPAEADLPGYAGWQQDFAVLPNPDYQGNARDDIPAGVHYLRVVQQFFAPGFSWTNSSPEAQLRFVVVNAGDTLLFVCLEAPPADFATFVTDADQILQTLELLEP